MGNARLSGHDRLKSCTSLPDLIGRHLLIEYCGREELAHGRALVRDPHKRMTRISERTCHTDEGIPRDG